MSKTAPILSEVVRTLDLESRAITAHVQKLKDPQSPQAQSWEKAILLLQKVLASGGKIVLTGVGKSGKIAQKIAATLSSTGSSSIFLHPTEGLHGDLGFVRPEDIVIALSYTGNTEELLRILPAFKQLGTPLIALTGNPRSTLAAQAQAVIDASVEQEACPHNLAPTTSTTLALAIGDAIAVALMGLRGFKAEDFAKNHPGGSLGRKLHLTVAEVMHRGDEVGVVTAETKMDQVVIVSTQKRLGGVLVTQDRQLLGVITDGDIRRALSHRERFFEMKAQDVMTKNPVTASPEMMAREALALMENRPSQISVLPVIDPQGRWEGLIRLHDLLQAF